MLNVTGDLTKKSVLIENMPKMYKEKIKLREKCNRLLDTIINLNISLHPELRYIQNLWVLGIIDQCVGSSETLDRFSEESYDTIKRIMPQIVDLINNKFPEKANIEDRIMRGNIFMYLDELGLAKVIDNFKLFPME